MCLDATAVFIASWNLILVHFRLYWNSIKEQTQTFNSKFVNLQHYIFTFHCRWAAISHGFFQVKFTKSISTSESGWIMPLRQGVRSNWIRRQKRRLKQIQSPKITQCKVMKFMFRFSNVIFYILLIMWYKQLFS